MGVTSTLETQLLRPELPQGSYREVWVKFKDFQGLLKTILQFSRTKSLGKILIEVLKLIFKIARLR